MGQFSVGEVVICIPHLAAVQREVEEELASVMASLRAACLY